MEYKNCIQKYTEEKNVRETARYLIGLFKLDVSAMDCIRPRSAMTSKGKKFRRALFLVLGI